MRFWILVLLPALFLLGCNRKVAPTDSGGTLPQDTLNGVPAAPANVHVQFFVGRGIAVNWDDRSTNERWFALSHGLLGFAQTIDTLPANTVFYFDSVAMAEGHYTYKVRAGNDNGWSPWSTTLNANYRLASDGLIPLRFGNFWVYHVDSGATHYDYRRSVEDFRVIDGEDFYLVMDSLMSGGTPEGRFYLRNGAESTTLLRFPLDSATQVDTLFRYPHIHANDWYVCQGDSFWVLTDPSGITQRHVGPGYSTFTGVVGFQRFLSHDHRNSIQYFIVPNRIGIIREINM
jgi:hypothetical protein